MGEVLLPHTASPQAMTSMDSMENKSTDCKRADNTELPPQPSFHPNTTQNALRVRKKHHVNLCIQNTNSALMDSVFHPTKMVQTGGGFPGQKTECTETPPVQQGLRAQEVHCICLRNLPGQAVHPHRGVQHSGAPAWHVSHAKCHAYRYSVSLFGQFGRWVDAKTTAAIFALLL